MEASLDVSGLPEVSFAQGDVVLEQGQTGSKVYILKSGSVAVLAGGNEICKFGEAGTVLGEISALLGGEISATVKAETEATFEVIDNLDTYCADHPGAGFYLARVLAQRVVNMNVLFADIRSEIKGMEAEGKGTSKLWSFIERIDQFWATEVFAVRPLDK
jgi:CRP-like cAMP-binding protein